MDGALGIGPAIELAGGGCGEAAAAGQDDEREPRASRGGHLVTYRTTFFARSEAIASGE